MHTENQANVPDHRQTGKLKRLKPNPKSMLIAVCILVLLAAGYKMASVLSTPNTVSALTVKLRESAQLKTIGAADKQSIGTLNVNVDSYNELYYSWSPDGKYLVYGNNGDIFIYDSSTRQSRNLTNTANSWELMPSWSPDSETLAFTSRPLEEGEGGASAEVWAMAGGFWGSPCIIKLDGSEYKQLEQGQVRTPITWSPDGKEIAYAIDGRTRIFNFKNNNARDIIAGDYGLDANYLVSPSWSVSKHKLAVFFSRADKIPNDEELFTRSAKHFNQGYAVLDLKKKTSTVVYQNEGPFLTFMSSALWNSDGDRLALHLRPELGVAALSGLFVVDSDGQNLKEFGDAYKADWEPNGERLAFIDGGDYRLIHIVDPSKNWSRESIKNDEFLQGFTWQNI